MNSNKIIIYQDDNEVTWAACFAMMRMFDY